MEKKALLEALKEAGRVVLLAVVPILISSLESSVFDLRVILVAAGLALLRAVDKYLHLVAPEGKAGGLTRF